ncbi:TIR domain-containing protein [Algoriphagus sp. NG3]|uniref:TIR domain-containing protein n=1 Tax=Algoriphagus sp. NG3 TaxID=3097546 RepID=UPI002A814581|nr:TIR domain-containing protein [Algoriphagus sp. NG3]WPR73750.1 TIR domain-containing protein [Algoriphagus sp. NG3]
MALFTSSYLRGVSQNKSLNESIQLSAQPSNKHSTFDVFLCHSFLDKEEVEGLYMELTRKGLKVYVDWIVDPQLDRNNVTRESAELVRNRLKSSRTLLLALSHNADLSKWVPWELGYVDGHTQRCALVPVSKDNASRKSFERREYLKLYPYLEKPNDLSGFRDTIFAVDSSMSYVEFDSWIKGVAPMFNTRNFY